MDSRRDFIKKAAMLSGGASVLGALPPSIAKAFAIDPPAGSTFYDAEHVVILMQENRSFDHCYGSLQGVRGFNDPRAITLPNQNPVWLQSNKEGETYAPFHLDIKNTKITWMGSLPHSWTNQTDARNEGKYDKWLDVKQPDEEYKGMPLTMGYYTREDIPFYYSLADAFTVCDQHFCSSLTGTTPNRLYLWTGTIREQQHENSKANVWNEDIVYDSWGYWKTYPERLEENGVSWKIYQNDISVDGGFTDEEGAWLDNFGDNPIEYFAQYNVKFSERYINYLAKAEQRLPVEIEELEKKIHNSSTPGSKELKQLKDDLAYKQATLKRVLEDKKVFTKEKYNQLSQHEKNLHEKAFCVNKNDPHYRELTTHKYMDGTVEREINIPKGDVLHQFRQDVKTGKLPTVSWLVAPETYSDHPSSAWFGAWYLSETLDILTQNPEVWKKTIFILTYDENDGYFDHVPPFTAPNAHDARTGKVSAGVDTSSDFVTMDQERRKKGTDPKYMREGPIGLGYRVPMVVASPWSRGGWVCSQVFDHTSPLQFLEKFLQKKTGKEIKETNITPWRRMVSGDLTSVFRPYHGEKITTPPFLAKDAFVEKIHKAKFKQLPSGYKLLSKDDISSIKQSPATSPLMPKQEKGVRSACALPYEIYVDGGLSADKKSFEITMGTKKAVHGERTAGVPFNVYAPGKYMHDDLKAWAYAAAAGDSVQDSWQLSAFDNNQYHLRVYGPNGFYREFKGTDNDPGLQVTLAYDAARTGLTVQLNNTGKEQYTVELIDNSYNAGPRAMELSDSRSMPVDATKSFGWYDISIKVKGNNTFEKRYAGRIETGKPSFSDPLMGRG